MTNPYDRAESVTYYGPDLVRGDRVELGYPYLPASMLHPLVGHLLGDVRLGAVICLTSATIVLRRLARDEVGRVLSTALLVSPLTAPVVLRYWVEPSIVLFLCLGVLGLRGGRRGLAAAGLGLLFASKQYLVVAVPVLLLLRRSPGGVATVRCVVVVAVACCAPFVLAGPAGFFHDLVEVQMHLPYRRDSISLLVAWGNTFGAPPSWLTSYLPLVGGVAVSTALEKRSRLDPATTVSAVVGLSLLTTVLLSKQAYANYYFLTTAALVVASVTWQPARAGDDPSPGSSGHTTSCATGAGKVV